MTNSMAIKKNDNIFKRAGARIVFMWRNKRHFKMQTFGMGVLVCILIFLFNLLSIQLDYDNMIRISRENTTVFTSSFPMSLTGDYFNVQAAYVDTTKTKAFIFMKNGNDMADIPIDANMYNILITEEDYSTPEENITGSIYILGSTGYMGIYLQSDIPFKNSVKHLYVRALRNTTSNTQPVVVYDESDYYYNQGHLFMNLGSYTAGSVDFLEKHQMGDDFDFKRVYRTILLANSEKADRDGCLRLYSEMKDAMLKIEESYSRIKGTYTDVVLPDFPTYLVGDTFKTVSVYRTDGTVAYSYEKFVPKTLLPGGIDFDWYNGNIADGYYKLVPNTNGLTISEYLASIPAGNDKIRYNPAVYYADGRRVISSDDADNAFDKSVARDVEAYLEQIQTYLNAKNTYQVKYLPAFLKLEQSSLDVDKLLSVNISENAVLCI